MKDWTGSRYRILEPLGSGGMGEVYKAEDTRLKRVVALKLLPRAVAGTGEAVERFEREAQAAASLDHPNICTLYEIGQHDGDAFLTMAFVEGESLDRRIERGPLSLELACEIARQTAEGLAAAHGAGVVHRDIKPSNIMLGEDGAGKALTKLLDFGLARLSGASDLTQADSRMGTTAYMSPEQALGEGVDARTDLWSLGVVLYEMVTGQRPFKGDYDQAILYSILNEEPEPVTALRTAVPLELEWIIDKCLAKRPGERYHDARELIVDLERLRLRSEAGKTRMQPISAGLGEDPPEVKAEPLTSGPVPRRALLPLGGAVALVLAFAAGWWTGGPAPEASDEVKRFTLRPTESFGDGQAILSAAISPDGRNIAFTTGGSGGSVWIQPLDQFQPYRVDGIVGARHIFWSPDSSELGYATAAGIGKVALRGLGVTQLVSLDSVGGASLCAWCPAGQFIVFSSPRGDLNRISSLGGAARPLVSEAEERRRRGMVSGMTCFSDANGEDVLLYSVHTWDSDTVFARRLSGGEAGPPVTLVDGAEPSYSPTGQLLYRPEWMKPALWAVDFSAEHLSVIGEPFVVAPNAHSTTVSGDGSLAYLDSPHTGRMALEWVGPDGQSLGSIGKPQEWVMGPRISPSGDQVLVTAGTGRQLDLWVHETERPVVRRLSFDDDEETGAVWAPSSDGVLISRRGSTDLLLVSAGGGRATEVIYSDKDGAVVTPMDWSKDGRYILVERRAGARPPAPGEDRRPAGRRAAIGYLVRADEADALEYREFLPAGPYFVDDVVFSPDARYVAYQSNESGSAEVYISSFPDAGQRWQVTTGGGRLPRWSPDGTTLYFLQNFSLYGIEVDLSAGLQLGLAQRLFSRDRFLNTRRFSAYDVGPTGRFVVPVTVGAPSLQEIRVVLNWLADFERP